MRPPREEETETIADWRITVFTGIVLLELSFPLRLPSTQLTVNVIYLAVSLFVQRLSKSPPFLTGAKYLIGAVMLNAPLESLSPVLAMAVLLVDNLTVQDVKRSLNSRAVGLLSLLALGLIVVREWAVVLPELDLAISPNVTLALPYGIINWTTQSVLVSPVLALSFLVLIVVAALSSRSADFYRAVQLVLLVAGSIGVYMLCLTQGIYLLSFLPVVITLAAYPKVNWGSSSTGVSGTIVSSVAVACVAVIVLALHRHGEASEHEREKRIGFIGGGLKLPGRLTLSKLTETEPVAYQPLLQTLRAYTFGVQVLPENIESEHLGSFKVICAVMPTKPASATTVERLEAFVRAGGTLVVVGDHTNIAGVRDAANSLLSFTAMRLRFDSVMPIDDRRRWVNSVFSTRSAPFLGSSNKALQISVGASIETSQSARSLVIGSPGFGDVGNPSFGVSRLGDMQLNEGESRGSLSLVAEQTIGLGKVIVWGDSSPFQAGSLVNSHGSLARFFSYCFANAIPLPHYSVMIMYVFGTVFLLAITSACHRVVPQIVILLMLASEQIAEMRVAQAITQRIQFGSTVICDDSIRSRLPTSDVGDSLHMLASVVGCNETPVLNMPLSDALSGGGEVPQAILIVAPSSLSEKKTEQLLNYVRSGGRLIVLTSGNDASTHLLSRLNLQVSKVSASTAHQATLTSLGESLSRSALAKQGVSTLNKAGRLMFKDAHFLEGAVAGESIIECWGKTLAVRRRIDEGVVTVIADSSFGCNKNMGVLSVNVANATVILSALN